MENTNLLYALSEENVAIGSVRETFFFNQVSTIMPVRYNGEGDFLVNKKYVFEVGGLAKKTRQIKSVKNSFIVKDGIEFPVGNAMPLWIFGLLY